MKRKLRFWYTKPDDSQPLSNYFECGEGWFPLINEAISKIEDIMNRDNLDIQLSQIKEKFGGLRMYLTSTTDEIEQIIDDANKKALVTCELCGAPGHFLSSFDGWYAVRCPKCAKEGLFLVEISLTKKY